MKYRHGPRISRANETIELHIKIGPDDLSSESEVYRLAAAAIAKLKEDISRLPGVTARSGRDTAPEAE